MRRPSGVVLGDLDEKSQPSRKLCGTQSEGFVRAFVETADRDKAFVAGAPEQRVDKDFQLVAVRLEHGSIDSKRNVVVERFGRRRRLDRLADGRRCLALDRARRCALDRRGAGAAEIAPIGDRELGPQLGADLASSSDGYRA